MRTAGRNRKPGCRLSLGHLFKDHQPDKLSPSGRSETRVSVHDPGPPVWSSWRTSRTLRTGPDDFLAAHNVPGHVSQRGRPRGPGRSRTSELTAVEGHMDPK